MSDTKCIAPLLLALLSGACGSRGAADGGAGTAPDSGTPDSGTGTPDSGTPDAGTSDAGRLAFPFPTVGYHGAPLITAPKVVSISFPGDSLATQLDAFGASVASSSYWDTIRAGYCGDNMCIGDGPAGSAMALSTPAAASYTDSVNGGNSTLQTLLSGLITGNMVPAPDANTIYVLYFPSTTVIRLDGAQSCVDFDGYHSQMPLNAQTIVYAVVPECAAPSMTPAISLLQNTTITASHEIIESASDGIGTQTAVGFYLDVNKDPSSIGWYDIQGGEIADLCVDQFGLGQDETTEGSYTVQRVWSITNAAAGENPCVPVPAGEVYFNTYPSATVVVTDVGTSQTLTVTALADGAISPWTVSPQDWTESGQQYVSFSIAGSTGGATGPEIQVKSGDTFQLTVTLVEDPANAPYDEADAVLVSANGPDSVATAAHFWPFIVLTTAEAAMRGLTMQ